MAQATEHPLSKSLSTLGRAAQVCATQDLDLTRLAQLLVSDTSFRDEVRSLIDARKPKEPTALVIAAEVPDEFTKFGFGLLMRAMYGLPDNTEHLPSPEIFRSVLKSITPRTASIIVLRYGLGDGIVRDRTEVGVLHNISNRRAAEIETSAISLLRGRVSEYYQRLMDEEDAAGTPISVLGLSERPSKCLDRARIRSVERLCTRTEDDLLDIVNFGQPALDEVVRKLDERGLSLKGE